MKELKRIAYDEFGDFAVSTTYLSDIEKYETMILFPESSALRALNYVIAKRYETMEEALKGHKEAGAYFLKETNQT